MSIPRSLIALITLVLASAPAQTAEPVLRTWQIDGVTREAMVYIPDTAKSQTTPVVYIFHGHGGRMQFSVRRYAFHQKWPEAITICPQGLNTPGKLTDPEGKKPGWQSEPGDLHDRDLKLFDAMQASLEKEYQIDKKRIYVTGHSNGGSFTYLLWLTRGDTFAALAPTATFTKPGTISDLKPAPKPIFHLAGETDPLVKYRWQELLINFLREYNQTAPGGTPWTPSNLATYYPPATPSTSTSTGAPLITYIHPGGHEFPEGAEDAIIKFFQSYPAKP